MGLVAIYTKDITIVITITIITITIITALFNETLFNDFVFLHRLI